MSKPYTAVPRFYHERFTIAIMTGESVPLHWRDASGRNAYVAKVFPAEIVEEDGMEYLLGTDDDGHPVRIRLDLIENMPSPVK